MTTRGIRRREFLARSSGLAAAGALGWLPEARGMARRVSANDRIAVGFIGVGSLGGNHHLPDTLKRSEFEVRAVCDVDRNHVDRALDRIDKVEASRGRASGYRDYRELLDRKDLDAVFVVTPDHWHALAAIDSCRAGMDVYCEKPLSLTVEEGRAMVDAARRYGRVFQVGSQQRSSHQFWWACDLVRNGRIGKLQKIQASIGNGPTCAFEPNGAPPAHLDWNAWLGPAPWTEYTEKRCHYTFRWFYDYSGGKMTDWGAHHLDIAQWGLGTSHSGPLSVEGSGILPSAGLYETAVKFDVYYRYPEDVVLHCTSDGENGVTFTGSKGSIFVSRSRIAADPAEILETEPDTGPVRLERSTDHKRNWIDCMASRERPICDVEVGHRSATVCHLGNIAIRLGRRLSWNPREERFVGDEEANRLLGKPMRAPHSLGGRS